MLPFRAPLHAAAFNDQTECLQYLLKGNVEVDAVDAESRTPLMVAAEKGHTKSVGRYPFCIVCERAA